jgi:inosine/xanthosine triphosphatase
VKDPPTQIAIGSKNPVKIGAVQMIIDRVWPAADLISVNTPSGVSTMPMSDAECLSGARQRASAALEMTGADLAIGLEGGVNPEPEGLMLLGWVVAMAPDGREGVAVTARLPLPPTIAGRVLSGEELGPVMDDLLNRSNTKQQGGAVGALTGGIILRKEAFATAVAYALAPFVTPRFYGDGANVGTP